MGSQSRASHASLRKLLLALLVAASPGCFLLYGIGESEDAELFEEVRPFFLTDDRPGYTLKGAVFEWSEPQRCFVQRLDSSHRVIEAAVLSPSGLMVVSSDRLGLRLGGKSIVASELFLLDADGLELRRLTSNQAPERMLRASQDGRRLFYVRPLGFSDGPLMVTWSGEQLLSLEIDSADETAVTEAADSGRILCLSPVDVDRVYYKSLGDWRAQDSFCGTPQEGGFAHARLDPTFSALSSTDATRFALIVDGDVDKDYGETRSKTLVTWRVGEKARTRASEDFTLIEHASFAPSGRHVIFAGAQGKPERSRMRPWLLDVDTGNCVELALFKAN